MNRVCDVAVVGLGAMGSAAVCHLARAGLSTIGIERHTSPHEHGSSHGGSRIIREAYFEDPRYVPLVQRAYDEWAALERDAGRTLMITTGGVMIGAPDSDIVRGALASARTHGLAHELIDAAGIRRRFPAFHPSPGMVGVWEPRAGVLFPEACIAAHLEQAARAGAELRTRESVLSWRVVSGTVEIATTRGVVQAGHVVLAAGAWMNAHLGGAAVPLAVERVVQAWFEPAGDAGMLAPERCPITIWYGDDGRCFYAFPLIDGAVKAALHHQGVAVDPDRVPAVEPHEIEGIRSALAKHIPAAAGAMRGAKTCMYTNTPDEHFVIDRHPAHPEVLIVERMLRPRLQVLERDRRGGGGTREDGRTNVDLGLFGIGRFG